MVKDHLFQLRIKNSFVKEISAMYVITKLLLTYTIIIMVPNKCRIGYKNFTFFI
jgi:hypothetical protein